MKVRIPQEVSSKQVAAVGVATLTLIVSLIVMILTFLSGRAEATASGPPAVRTENQTTFADARFDRPPHPVTVTPITVAKPLHKPVHKAVQKQIQKQVHKPIQKPHYVGGGGWAASASVWKKYPAWVQTFALCIVHHESWSAGLWTAYNPSGAGGAFQYMPPTWKTWLARAHLTGPSNARYASPILQSEVFAYTITHRGKGNWGPDHC